MAVLTIITGATVTFEALVKFVLCESFLKKLSEQTPIRKLIVQYGNEHKNGIPVSKAFFDKCINELNDKTHGLLSKTSSGDVERYTSSNYSLTLEAFPFSPNISTYIKNSDIIISHAGTGSIIDTLVQHRPLIVVVNSSLMDNHQEEIANELTWLNCCLKFTDKNLQERELIEAIVSILDGELTFKPLANNTDNVVQNIIYSSVS